MFPLEMWRILIVVNLVYSVYGIMDSTDVVDDDSDDKDQDSSEKLGAVVTQIFNHPYAASLLKNGTYECSAIILNSYWLLTLSKCFDSSIVDTYVSHKSLKNYTIRSGTSYNGKGGALYTLTMLVNNFDLKVTAVKLEASMVFSSKVQAVHLPKPEEEPTLGYLASILAWTPDGHMRTVNVPVIEPSICEDNTKLLPGHYICVGGVQDPNRNFCRQDNGGAVIQNNTIIAVATFVQTCAIYTRPHAFPKVAAFAQWLDSVIWDEDNRPTTPSPTTSEKPKEDKQETKGTEEPTPFYVDPSKFMLTLPYEPINVPLEPAEDNSVIPRMSLYESYLQNMARIKMSTSSTPGTPLTDAKIDQAKMEWYKKFGKAIMMMPQQMYSRKFDQYDYN